MIEQRIMMIKLGLFIGRSLKLSCYIKNAVLSGVNKVFDWGLYKIYPL
jgi:hypothetical protein